MRDSGQQHKHKTDTEQDTEQPVQLPEHTQLRIVLGIKDTCKNFFLFFFSFFHRGIILVEFLLRLHFHRPEKRILRPVQPLPEPVRDRLLILLFRNFSAHQTAPPPLLLPSSSREFSSA